MLEVNNDWNVDAAGAACAAGAAATAHLLESQLVLVLISWSKTVMLSSSKCDCGVLESVYKHVCLHLQLI